MELNEKKLYMEPVMKVIAVDCHDIIATSPGSGNNNIDDDEDPYTGRLN